MLADRKNLGSLLLQGCSAYLGNFWMLISVKRLAWPGRCFARHSTLTRVDGSNTARLLFLALLFIIRWGLIHHA
jgi:hypothetical protein